MFQYFHSNKNSIKTGEYVNGKKQGIWVGFHSNGVMGDSALFENREIAGTLLAWYSKGFLADSSVRMEDGSGVSVGGLITEFILKRLMLQSSATTL